MWGNIIGDLAGSIYEFSQVKQVTPINATKLITDKSFYSDDTILTIAIIDAILNNKDYSFYLKEYGKKHLNYKPNFTPYFKNSFSPGFMKWLKEDSKSTSTGNGAMMRIAPVGYLFNTEEEVIENAKLATIPSHNSKSAIECATTIALIIYYSRKNLTKEEIIKKLNLDIKYTPFTYFNTTCNETINNCLYALFTNNNFKDCIKTVLSYGGDTDTNACIVGGMAEAMYGIDDNLIKQAKEKIPKSFTKKLELSYRYIEKNNK